MFSSTKKQAHRRAFSIFPAVAAGLAFVLLLAALFQVTSGQVEQAKLRQSQYRAAQTAIASCAASHSGAVRRQCMDQVQAGFTPYSTYTPTTEVVPAGTEPAKPAGLMQASLARN